MYEQTLAEERIPLRKRCTSNGACTTRPDPGLAGAHLEDEAAASSPDYTTNSGHPFVGHSVVRLAASLLTAKREAAAASPLSRKPPWRSSSEKDNAGDGYTGLAASCDPSGISQPDGTPNSTSGRAWDGDDRSPEAPDMPRSRRRTKLYGSDVAGIPSPDSNDDEEGEMRKEEAPTSEQVSDPSRRFGCKTQELSCGAEENCMNEAPDIDSRGMFAPNGFGMPPGPHMMPFLPPGCPPPMGPGPFDPNFGLPPPGGRGQNPELQQALFHQILASSILNQGPQAGQGPPLGAAWASALYGGGSVPLLPPGVPGPPPGVPGFNPAAYNANLLYQLSMMMQPPRSDEMQRNSGVDGSSYEHENGPGDGSGPPIDGSSYDPNGTSGEGPEQSVDESSYDSNGGAIHSTGLSSDHTGIRPSQGSQDSQGENVLVKSDDGNMSSSGPIDGGPQGNVNVLVKDDSEMSPQSSLDGDPRQQSPNMGFPGHPDQHRGGPHNTLPHGPGPGQLSPLRMGPLFPLGAPHGAPPSPFGTLTAAFDALMRASRFPPGMPFRLPGMPDRPEFPGEKMFFPGLDLHAASAAASPAAADATVDPIETLSLFLGGPGSPGCSSEELAARFPSIVTSPVDAAALAVALTKTAAAAANSGPKNDSSSENGDSPGHPGDMQQSPSGGNSSNADDAESNLPPHVTISDLFPADYPCFSAQQSPELLALSTLSKIRFPHLRFVSNRDYVLLSMPRCIVTKRGTLLPPLNSPLYLSHVVGVVWDKVHNSWVVTYTLRSRRHFHNFPAKRFGFLEARQRAIFLRLEKDREKVRLEGTVRGGGRRPQAPSVLPSDCSSAARRRKRPASELSRPDLSPTDRGAQQPNLTDQE